MSRLLVFIFLVISSSYAFAQEITVKVVDANNKQPLAFVNIKFDDSQKGVSTDIDGYFKIKNPKCCELLNISYIGYKDTSIARTSLISNSLIQLDPIMYRLEIVDILPSENPAFALIRNVIINRKNNKP